MTGPRILLLHEEADVRALWKQRLLRAGFPTLERSTADALRGGPESLSLLICGDSGDGSRGFRIIEQMREVHPGVPVIFVADRGSEDLAVRALRAGVSDYIGERSNVEELAAAVTRVLNRPDCFSDRVIARCEDDTSGQMVGSSSSMQAIKSCLARIAAADSNVLLVRGSSSESTVGLPDLRAGRKVLIKGHRRDGNRQGVGGAVYSPLQ